MSFPENWGKKEIKYAEIHWHKCSIREPQQKDIYLVTISSRGIQNYTMVSEWTGDMWNCDYLGEVIAWSNFPSPYEEAK